MALFWVTQKFQSFLFPYWLKLAEMVVTIEEKQKEMLPRQAAPWEDYIENFLLKYIGPFM